MNVLATVLPLFCQYFSVEKGEIYLNELILSTFIQIIDFENPANNTFHCTAEFTCKRDQDEFRPDITLFINGLPLVFIEVKKPNNHGGMVAESQRMYNGSVVKTKI